MSAIMEEMGQRALKLGIPLSVQLDLTYRCNERCVHCYLDHEDHGEMNTQEIKTLLDEMAAAGVFFLTLSGGEILMRKDFFEILEHARALMFCVKLKTNAILIREKEAERIRALGVESIQISVYSHRPEIHDAITKIPGSLERSIHAIRFLKSYGLKVIIANVLMIQNIQDQAAVRALGQELDCFVTIDPTITPMMDGNREVLNLNISHTELGDLFHNPELVGDVDEYCAIPAAPDADVLDSLPCSAGHTAAYVSPYGDVYPCVQFPLPTGNVREKKFLDIWRYSPEMNEVRSITLRDLTSCSKCSNLGSCTRCPGLAYMEGNMRGSSTQDCEKSLVRTGVMSENLKARKNKPLAGLIQIQGMTAAVA